MLLQRFLSFLFVLMIVFIAACKQRNSIPVIHSNLKSDSDGIVRDITMEYRSEYRQNIKKNFEKSLGLDDLQNGYKRLQIRVFTSYGLDNRNRLLTIKNDGVSWKGELHYFRDSFADRIYQGGTRVERTELNETPEAWGEFVDKLFSMKIDKLRDYSQIPEYGTDPDEDGFFVELAQDSFYKAFLLPTPTARQKEIKDARYAVQIMKLIDKKFGNRLKDSTYRGE